MKPLRRLQLALCCLLAVLLGSGAVLPSPAVWQCRYSSHVISAAFTPAPNAMPCLMGHSTVDSTMPPMPCCHLAKSTAHRSSHGELTLLSPPCHPTLTSLAAVPALGMMGANLHLRQSLAAQQAALPLTAAFAVSAPLTLSLRQRPPPTVGSPLTAPAYSFGLRAPPFA